MNALLIELLTEELPPKSLKKLGEAFAQGIAQGLQAHKLTSASSVVSSYATARRLAVHISQVASTSPDGQRRDKLLPVAIAFDAAGKPTAPLLKKLAALGLTQTVLPSLERAPDGKTETLFYQHTAAGKPLAQILQEVLTETLSKLPVAKVMFYERDDGTPVHFVRPAHSLIVLHGDSVLPVSALGLQAGDTSKGHRFHCQGSLTITHADKYADILREAGQVIASYSERRENIVKQLNALAKGDEIIAPDALLDEVTALVEWPAVYECHFEEAFLQVPQECLILTMQTNQKYFAIRRNGKLSNRFLMVSNIETHDPSFIVGGNERVVRPRLADAKFFFDQDRKQSLEARLPKLAHVVYHGKLGSQAQRKDRVVLIAQALAADFAADEGKASRAANLAKADLLTDMVGEFPELQGIMGTYYALHDQEDAEVAQAITEQYQPRFAGDALPTTKTGTVLAVADKLETLFGLFSIGQMPTGDKDPFALRRHALGILRILIEKNLNKIDVNTLLAASEKGFGSPNQNEPELISFFSDRLAVMLREQGYSPQQVDAVLPLNRFDKIAEIPKRLAALRMFSELPEAAALAAANKRISNILKKSEGVPPPINPALFQEEAEKSLFGALQNVKPLAEKLFHNHEYAASLRELAALREPVDAFFDKVMVNAEDLALRGNRLALLAALHVEMNRVADLGKLAS